MSVTTVVPHISAVSPNSPEFRAALAKAKVIVAGSGLNVHSRHWHFETGVDEVLFEELVLPGELAQYPLSVAEAVENGLPSCWAFGFDGSVMVERYASRELHLGSGIDVTSSPFQAQLAQIGRAFVAAGLHTVLEVSIADCLFPTNGEGTVTIEETDVEARRQRVTVVPMTDAVRNGDWATIAGWGFTSQGELVPTRACTTGEPPDHK